MPDTQTGNGFELFAPFSKIDERTGEFEAWATVEEIDSSGEIIDIDKSWPYFQALADQFSAATGGSNFGPLREQHDPQKASGHLIAPPVLKDHSAGKRGVFISGVVTDPVTKDKMTRKTLTGISIGGSYVGAKETVTIDGRTAKKFVAAPNHYAPVDSPCVKGALVTMVKADGSVTEEPLRKEVVQFWDCLNDTSHRHLQKADALKCTGVTPLAKAAMCACCTDGDCGCSSKADGACTCKDSCVKCKTNDCEGLASEKAAPAGDARKLAVEVQIVSPSDIHKSLWNVSGLASILAQLLSITRDEEYDETWDAIQAMQNGEEASGNGIPVVEQLKVMCQSVFNALEAMLANERAELDAELNGEMAMAAVARGLMKSPIAKQLIKSLRVPSGNGSSSTTTITKEAPVSTPATPVVTPKTEEKPVVAPETVAKAEAPACSYPDDPIGHMHAGGVCKAEKMDATAAAVIKALGPKFDGVTAELTKRDERMAEIEGALGTLTKGVNFLLNQPAQPLGALRAAPVQKSADTTAEAETPAAPVTPAKPVLKYESEGREAALEVAKTMVAGGFQNIDAPPRGAVA